MCLRTVNKEDTRVRFENSKFVSLLIIAVMVALTSCAAPQKKVYDIVWPLPPEEPRIRYVDVWQANLDIAGSEGGVAGSLFGEEVISIRKPYGVATDKEGRVYVTDAGAVYVFDARNKKFSSIGTEIGPGRLSLPASVAVSNSDGKVYVTDIGAKRVFVYNKDGKYLTAIGHEKELENPIGIAIDDERQKLYVVDSKKHAVSVYSLEGKLIQTIGSRGNGPAQFNQPSFMTLDSSGNIYVVDTQNFRVQVFDPEWKLIRTIGQLGDVPGNFSRPKGIAIDSEGHIYVVDAAFQNVQIFDKEGQLLLFVGSGGTRPGEFALPAGIAIDGEDRIYVVEQFASRIQIFQYLGEKWKKSHPELMKIPEPASKEGPVKKNESNKETPVENENQTEKNAR